MELKDLNPFKKKEGDGGTATARDAGKPVSWDDDIDAAALENKAARTRKRKTAPAVEDGQPAVHPQVTALQSDLEKLLTPENLAPLIQMPGAAMLAQSGFKHWEVGEKEAMRSAVPASVCAKYYGNVDPGKLAVAFLLVNLAITYGPRTVEHFRLRALQVKNQTEPNGKK